MEERAPIPSASVPWPLPGTLPELHDDEVHLWACACSQTAACCREYESVLSTEEKERAARFRVEHARIQFMAGRILLRRLLEAYIATPAAELVFLYGTNGKPHLAPWQSSSLQFNLSHSGDLVVIALASKRDVGVDVEYICPLIEAEAIAERFLSGLGSKVRAPETFYTEWTRREARAKCTGAGLAALSSNEPFNGVIRQFWPACHYIGAVAAAGQEFGLQTWAWHPDLRFVTRNTRASRAGTPSSRTVRS